MHQTKTTSIIRPVLSQWRLATRAKTFQSPTRRFLHLSNSHPSHFRPPQNVYQSDTPLLRVLRPATHSAIRFISSSPSDDRSNSAYSWIDAEAEDLISRAYSRHKALADKSQSFPPSLSVTELERIGVPYTKKPVDFVDRLAFRLNKTLKIFVHAFFREKYDHHAVCLETVAAVPGMVAAFHRHMRSLRNMRRDHSWIQLLSEESENERMHLLIFLQVTNPTALERSLVVVAQGLYLSFYSLMYFFIPRAAHRLTGFLEETAHEAYTDYLNCIDSGKIKNKPAPEIARRYYRLPEDATMRDVILHVRADEACHRDVNHHLADKYAAGDADSRPTPMNSGLRSEEITWTDEFPEEDDKDASIDQSRGAA